MQEQYTHTVVDFSDNKKKYHFADIAEATTKANGLLAIGHKCKIYPYKSEFVSRIDYIAANEERFKPY